MQLPRKDASRCKTKSLKETLKIIKKDLREEEFMIGWWPVANKFSTKKETKGFMNNLPSE